jgi:type III secretion protein L
VTSKHFFSLIHGDKVNIAPQTRVIPGAEIATLLDAENVLKVVREDAEKYKKTVVAECEKLKDQAQREGFEEGFKQWAEHVAKLEAEIVKVRQDMERVVIPIALKAAKKIVGREIELSDNSVVDIVANNLKAVSQHKKIIIYVNKKDIEVLEANKTRLRQVFENLEALSIKERPDIQPGGCIIETEGGIINAQLENQWRILEAAFESFTRPK